jgi:hypothetical protein
MPGSTRHGWTHLRDRACVAAVLLAQIVCAGILLVTAAFVVWCMTSGPEPLYPVSKMGALWLLPYAATIAAGQRLRQHLVQRPERRRAHATFLGLTLLALFSSLGWFRDPMHDIALFFGSHGRWGCSVVNDDGSPYYLLRDDTMPFILFAPVLLTVAAHGLATRRSQVRAVSR